MIFVMVMSGIKQISLSFILMILLIVMSGCQFGRGMYVPGVHRDYAFEHLRKHTPQVRIGTIAGSSIVAITSNPYDLGKHGYRSNGSEQNGVLYTCRGGHIDLAHLRNVADYTGHLASQAYEHVQNADEEYSFVLGEEAVCFVRLDYPSFWEGMSVKDREPFAKDIAYRLGEYFAYQSSILHEINTWFGYKSAAIYPEFSSAFSWEDTYSNLLGSQIAYAALNNDELGFSDAVTLELAKEMYILGVQPRRTVRQAAKMIKGENGTGVERSFDVGLDDGFITPIVAGQMCGEENCQPISHPVPTLALVKKRYGVDVEFRIQPTVWEKRSIMRAAFGQEYDPEQLIDPEVEFEKLMTYIQRQAAQKYGIAPVKTKSFSPLTK